MSNPKNLTNAPSTTNGNNLFQNFVDALYRAKNNAERYTPEPDPITPVIECFDAIVNKNDQELLLRVLQHCCDTYINREAGVDASRITTHIWQALFPKYQQQILPCTNKHFQEGGEDPSILAGVNDPNRLLEKIQSLFWADAVFDILAEAVKTAIREAK